MQLMSNTATQEKIRKIELDLEAVKRLFAVQPNFSSDEKNWTKIRKTVKQVRRANFKRTYGARKHTRLS